MTKKKPSLPFKLIKWLIKVFYPRIQVEGIENLTDEPVIIVGNHCQMNGPIIGELYVPGEPYIWCAGEMMHRETVPEYAFRDFWSQKPKWTHPFYKLLSYIITPFSVCIFNNARTIGVYHDARSLSTFKNTVKKLQEGKSVVIFPEHDVKHNHILYDFQDKFIDIARLYHKKTGKALSFVPMYIAPRLKKLCLGKPIRFDADEPMDTQRSRICSYLMDEITAIAEGLPEHTVVPYRNIPKKDYPSNHPGPRGYFGSSPLSTRSVPMKKPVVDYRAFRLRKMGEPQFAHLKLLLGWVGYFALYFLTENLIPAENCHPVHMWLDDLIPFCEWFILPYVFWYGLVVFSLGYFLLYNVDSFKRLQTYIIITQIIAMACYILYPTRQDLRPSEFANDNFLTRCIAFLYSFDTSTGVCPSLHVAYSLGMASVWTREKAAHPVWRAFVIFAVVMICLSTMFIKQHSAVDVFAAIPVCLIAEGIVYRDRYFRKTQ